MKLALITVAAVSLLFGTTISNAQDPGRPNSMAGQTERMRHEHGQRHDDGGRDHRRRPIVIVVGVPPIVAGSPYDYFPAPPLDLYRTLDGFYYYCAEPSGYYPTVPDCPSGWRLVP